jgi:hypothetical protein
MFSSGAFTSKNNTPGALIFGKQPDIMSLERYTVILPPYDRNHPIKENQDEGAVMIIESIDETNHLIYYKWSTQTQTAAQFNNVQINGNLVVDGTTTLHGDTIIDSTLNVCNINCNNILEITAPKVDITGDLTVTGDITGGSLTDGTATLSGGELSGATDITASGTIKGGSLTDGTATLSRGELSGATDITATGTITCVTLVQTSDKRLKKNIEKIQNPLEKLDKINGYTFDWIENKEIHNHSNKDIGVIAQEIEEVLPELTITRDNGYKAVKYDKLTALLIECVKSQQIQIQNLEKQIAKLSK